MLFRSDMQAGIHPIKKTGRAISSALGYAQLLDANSINELARSGETFISLLNRKLRDPENTPERTATRRRYPTISNWLPRAIGKTI